MNRQTMEKAQGRAQSISNAQGNEPSSLYLILLVISKSKDLTKIININTLNDAFS